MAQDPFLRPRLTVKKRRLPFRILEDLRARSLKEVNRLLQQAQNIINITVENAQPDPGDSALFGTTEVPPDFSLRTDKNVPAGIVEKALERRREHGGPTDWEGMWDVPESKKLAEQLDPEMFLPDNSMTGLEGTPEQKDVAVRDIWLVGTMTHSSLVKALTEPYAEPVLLLYEPKRVGYVILKGFSTVLAAKLSHVMSVNAMVNEGGQSYGEESWYRKALEVELLLAPLLGSTRSKGYLLLSAFEPLAQCARRLSREDFLALASGNNTLEEDKAHSLSEAKFGEQTKLWAELYSCFRDQGETADAARTLVSEDQLYRRVTSVAEALRNQSLAVATKWNAERSFFETMALNTKMMIGLDGINVKPNREMYETVWDQVDKAKHKKKRRPVYG